MTILSVSVMSCSDSGDIDNGEDTPISPEEVGNILEKASKDWGASQAEIISCMQGFRQVSGTAADMLQFKSAGNGVSIAYRFAGDKLMATSVLIPDGTGGLDFSSLIGGYTYVGELGGGNVYADFPANTMACTWQPVKWDDGYGVVGYAPIKADDYDFITPVTVTTDADVEVGMLEATLSGRVEGSTGDVKVGFMYGLDSSLSDAESVMATPDADGSFSITVNGLIDDADYYYCAYALFDGISYMGDVLSFHCPLTDETRGLVNARTLALMKRGAIIINTARGGIIDERALAEALNREAIGGACLDVLAEEPMSKDCPLFRAKNALITPHVAWVPRETRQRLVDSVAFNLGSFLKGSPVNVVNGAK